MQEKIAKNEGKQKRKTADRFFEYFITRISAMTKEKAMKHVEEMLGPFSGQIIWGFIRMQIQRNWRRIKRRIVAFMISESKQEDCQHISDIASYIASELLGRHMVPEDIVKSVVAGLIQDAQFCVTVKRWAEERSDRTMLLRALPKKARKQERRIIQELITRIGIEE